MARQKVKVLYFIMGNVATDEDRDAIEAYSGRHIVCIRSAPFISDTEALEPFDLVAGAVPARYAAEAESRGVFTPPPVPVAPIASVPAGSPAAPVPAAKVAAPSAKAANAWKPNA